MESLQFSTISLTTEPTIDQRNKFYSITMALLLSDSCTIPYSFHSEIEIKMFAFCLMKSLKRRLKWPTIALNSINVSRPFTSNSSFRLV